MDGQQRPTTARHTACTMPGPDTQEVEAVVADEVVRGSRVEQRAERPLRAGDVETDEDQPWVVGRGGGTEMCVKHGGGLEGPVATGGPGPPFQPVWRPHLLVSAGFWVSGRGVVVGVADGLGSGKHRRWSATHRCAMTGLATAEAGHLAAVEARSSWSRGKP